MSTDELEDYVNSQFDELRRLVRLEERRTLHLVDLKEAFLTASAAEKIAEISSETERLQEEMADITNQLCLLEQAEAGGPAVLAQALIAVPAPAQRAQVRRTLLFYFLYSASLTVFVQFDLFISLAAQCREKDWLIKAKSPV